MWIEKFGGGLLAALCLVAMFARAQEPGSLSDIDRIRLTEGFRLADAIGNRVWPDWDKAPFAVLLVTREHEFLIRHPKPSADFTSLGEDSVLKQKVWLRPRKHSPDLAATFPAVGAIPTIVIGQAENTSAKTSTRWVITMLHEHFHQLQNSQPRYYADVDALGLARGDQTGMWMLNYDFPYASADVKEHFSIMCRSLADALQARKQPEFSRKLADYVEKKKKLQSMLKPEDYKYLCFQAWQEGIAHYTEYQLAELAAAEYEPSKDFQNLKDYTSFKQEAGAIGAEIEKELTSVELATAKRTAFYALGAGEGLVLDVAHPGWRKRYFEEKFSLDKHFRTQATD